MEKTEKPNDQEDRRRFEEAMRQIRASQVKSAKARVEIAISELREMGIVDEQGNLVQRTLPLRKKEGQVTDTDVGLE